MKTKSETLDDIDHIQDYLWRIDAHIGYMIQLGKIKDLIVKTEPIQKDLI